MRGCTLCAQTLPQGRYGLMCALLLRCASACAVFHKLLCAWQEHLHSHAESSAFCLFSSHCMAFMMARPRSTCLEKSWVCL